MGIRKLDLLNTTLLSRLVWQFAIENEDAAQKVYVGVKYEKDLGGWFTKSLYGSSLWESVNKETVSLKQRCSFQQGNGEKILFWETSGAVTFLFVKHSQISIAWRAQKGQSI